MFYGTAGTGSYQYFHSKEIPNQKIISKQTAGRPDKTVNRGVFSYAFHVHLVEAVKPLGRTAIIRSRVSVLLVTSTGTGFSYGI
jgi:hypothetical protein